MSKPITLSQEEIMPLWRCYLALTKPKVVALMLLTAVVGMCLSNPDVFLVEKALLGLLGIGLMAGAAASPAFVEDKPAEPVLVDQTPTRPKITSGYYDQRDVETQTSGNLIAEVILWVFSLP